VPIVFLGLSEQWGDSVGPRDTQGGRLATEHLLALGHERIAYVRTPLVERSGDRARYNSGICVVLDLCRDEAATNGEIESSTRDESEPQCVGLIERCRSSWP
jgi:DNA-binding LacI/PurR family transcriptional regulator